MKLREQVDHPEHYCKGRIECIEAIRSALGDEGHAAFLRGQVLKYIWRLPHKGAALQDAKKARWYLDRLIEAGEAAKQEGDDR